MTSTFLERAKEVLRTNDRGRHTIPSARLYPHQWAWDSAFAAIGWTLMDVGRALDELEKLFESQWDDGRIPHIGFDPAAKDYFPGPEFWECDGTSSITNPPVWTTALRIAVERGADSARARELATKMELSLEFFSSARDPLGWGGVTVVHPWESGRDNCPAWDAPMAAVDPSRAPSFKRVDLEKVANPDERPTDEQYKRYAVLVKDIARDSYGPGSFAVYDPFMTAVLVRAEDDLAAVREALDMPRIRGNRRERALECLRRLWSPEHGRFAFHDVHTDRRYTPDVLAAHMPATVIGDDAIEARCIAEIEGRYRMGDRLPTVPREDRAFDPHCYWRGPSWVSMSWLFSVSKVGTHLPWLPEGTLRMVESAGFWEYFDPNDGHGLGTDCFTWSAALSLDLHSRILAG